MFIKTLYYIIHFFKPFKTFFTTFFTTEPSACTSSISTSSATRSSPANTIFSRLRLNPEIICVLGVSACTGNPTVSPRDRRN